MIIRKKNAAAQIMRLDMNGGFIGTAPEDRPIIMPGMKLASSPPFSPPVLARQICRVATLVTPRVVEGFRSHNAIYEITPANYAAVLEKRIPDYLLVESCLYDSRRAWARLAWNRSQYREWMERITKSARANKIPMIFWHTMGVSMLDSFIDVLREFDIVGCADHASLEKLKKKGINAIYLPLAFDPAQFNPLRGKFRPYEYRHLVYDGAFKLLRFREIQEQLTHFLDVDLRIIESHSLIGPYVQKQIENRDLAMRIAGAVSQTRIQDIYKSANACLCVDADQQTKINALQTAACRCPVLYIGHEKLDAWPGRVELFPNVKKAHIRYEEFLTDPLERDRIAHLAWREAHQNHTFAHRMDAIHNFFGLDKKAVMEPKATIITPSMRPHNFGRVMEQYDAQTWRNKELVYAFNGNEEDLPDIPDRPDIKVVLVPFDYSTGTAMNAAMEMAEGDYFFKLDDDDLYGANYVSDRMIYFNEFNISLLGTSRAYYKFAESDTAFIFGNANTELLAQPIGKFEWTVNSINGASMCMAAQQARRFGYPEQTYGGADGSFLHWNAFFSPAEASIDVDSFNFCVTRSGSECHTWKIGMEELTKAAFSRTAARNIFL